MEDVVDVSLMEPADTTSVQAESSKMVGIDIAAKVEKDTVENPVKIEAEDVIMSTPTDATSEQPPSGTESVKPSISETTSITMETAETENKALVPKLKESVKEDVMIMPPPIAPAILQKLRPSILELDTSATIFNMDSLEALMEGVQIGSLDVNSLFPDLPLYGPPNPEDNDAYLDEAEYGRVTMISRLMSSKPPVLEFGPLASQIVYVKRKREPTSAMDDFEEEDIRVPRIEGKVLNAIPGSEPPRTVPVLFQTKKNKEAPMTPIRKPAQPSAQAQKSPITWTSEEDEILMSLIKSYQYNWDLISDLFNSTRGPIPSSERRTPWDCYERWAKKEGPQSGGSSANGESSSGLIPIGNLPANSGSTPPSPKARKDKDGKRILTTPKPDPARKKPLAFSVSLMEAMKKSSKRRETAQNRVNPGEHWPIVSFLIRHHYCIVEAYANPRYFAHFIPFSTSRCRCCDQEGNYSRSGWTKPQDRRSRTVHARRLEQDQTRARSPDDTGI